MHPSDKCFGFQRKDAQKIHRGCCTWMGLIQRQEASLKRALREPEESLKRAFREP
jgi:hypothetical protein